MHPLSTSSGAERDVRLHKGRAKLLVSLDNSGPFATRVLAIRLVGAEGLRIKRLQTDSERAEAPTLEGLFKPLGKPTLDPGEASHPIYLTVASELCTQEDASASWTLDALDVDLRTADIERTQRVAISPALRVSCAT